MTPLPRPGMRSIRFIVPISGYFFRAFVKIASAFFA